ncbi:hypothetical protein D030_3283B, partial [Vibrio parahaemolyticus AQ3810]
PESIASWLPRNVPVCSPGFHVSCCLLITSSDIGKPPPIALERHNTSGTIPASSKAKL